MWIKTTQVGSGSHWDSPGVLAFEGGGNTNDYFYGIISNTGALRFHVGNAGFFTPSAINDGERHHFACVRNDDLGDIYVDGVLAATGGFDAGVKTPTHTSVGENEDSSGTHRGFDGIYDDVRIYNRILTAKEVACIHMAKGMDTIRDGLARRWFGNELSPGTAAVTLHDLTPNADNGAIADTPVHAAGFTRWRRRRAS
jgi:hypothetical protein